MSVWSPQIVSLCRAASASPPPGAPYQDAELDPAARCSCDSSSRCRPGFSAGWSTSHPPEARAEAIELVEDGIVDALRDELLEPPRRHLRGELYAPRCEAGAEGTLDLGIARGVDGPAEVAEESQDGADSGSPSSRSGDNEAEGMQEGERRPRRALRRGTLVDVARRAGTLAPPYGLGRRQQHRRQKRNIRARQMQTRAPHERRRARG